jgi:hypothetical protein
MGAAKPLGVVKSKTQCGTVLCAVYSRRYRMRIQTYWYILQCFHVCLPLLVWPTKTLSSPTERALASAGVTGRGTGSGSWQILPSSKFSISQLLLLPLLVFSCNILLSSLVWANCSSVSLLASSWELDCWATVSVSRGFFVGEMCSPTETRTWQ